MEQFFTAMVTFSWLFTSKLPMIPRNSDMGNLLVQPENGGRPCKGGSKKPLFRILPAYLAHWFLTPSSTTSLNKTSIYMAFLSFFPFPCNHSPKLGGLQSEKIRRSESTIVSAAQFGDPQNFEPVSDGRRLCWWYKIEDKIVGSSLGMVK